MTTATRTYKIDKSHSEAIFMVRHLVTKVRGRFTDFEGAIEYNEAAPEQSTVNFTIKTASVDTAEADRDKHLRSADFFDVENHPDMTFRSKRITKRGAETFDVVGDLTIRGVTKEVVLDATYEGRGRDPWGGERVSFSADTKIDRREFGLVWNAALETGGVLVSNEIRIHIEVQAVRAT